MVALKDIAKESGVSYAAVSYILNNTEKSKNFNADTREKVKKIAVEMGYAGDEIARSMVTGKTRTIGFISANTSTEFAAGILTGAMEAAIKQDHFLRLFSYGRETDMEKLVNTCIQQRLAGVVCYVLPENALKILRVRLRDAGIPMAVVSNSPSVDCDIHVYCDGHEGGRLAFEYLHSLGHVRMVHVSTYKDQVWSSDRREGFLEAAGENGVKIPSRNILQFKLKGTEIEKKVKELFSVSNVPTAIFCNSDNSAVNVFISLCKMGLSVPEDVSLLGYGNLQISHSIEPELSTVMEPFLQMGSRVIEILLAENGNGTKKAGKKIIEKINIEIVERESTGPI